MTAGDLESIIEEAYSKKQPLQELTGALLSGLKTAGFSIALYYIMKDMLKKALMDKKFTQQLTDQIATNLDKLRRQDVNKLLNPTLPSIIKGYGIVDRPTYMGKGQGLIVKKL